MPVCLKCGYELVFGPGGCACTQAARRERERQEISRAGDELMKKIGPALEEARRLGELPQAERDRFEIRLAKEKLDARKSEILHQQDLLAADWKALQRKCKHPGIREYSSMGELGQYCEDCSYQT